MEQEKIDKINFLAKKAKNEGLAEEEKQLQAALRKEYIESYKKSLVSQLEAMKIVEPDGSIKEFKQKS